MQSPQQASSPLSNTSSTPPAESSSEAALASDADRSKDSSAPTSRVKRLSNVVEKGVEKTVDKLNRSLSARSSLSGPPTPPANSRGIFSINRKGKGRQESGDNDDSGPTSSPPIMSSPTSPRASSTPSTIVPHEDSPFIRPPSPPPTRPSLSPFRGTGSMRPGTQTLIQALQALPWLGMDNEDDLSPLEHAQDAEGSDDEDDNAVDRMTSSIHTIHRPMARSRRRAPSHNLRPHKEHDSEDEEDSDVSGSDAEPDAEDFEDNAPKFLNASASHPVGQRGVPSASQGANPSLSRIVPSRTGSMATVRLQRRTRLAEKLKDVFQLEGIEEVVAEMPCWLLRSILLQGYMYLTNSYLCFFAHMPSRENQILKSGSLTKKAQRTKRWIKHWFVLKNDALSWYQSSSDPYFPHGIVDLKYALSCEPVSDKEIRIRTNSKTVTLSADSIPSRDEWVKAIRKVIFKAQNMGDSVKIAIPYSAIISVEKSNAIDFSETVEVKVIDNLERNSDDSYFFAYFHNLPVALSQIQDAVHAHRNLSTQPSPKPVLDTTISRSNTSSDRAVVSTGPKSATSVFRLTSLLRPLQAGISTVRGTTSEPPPESLSDHDDFTHISRRANSSFLPFTTSPQRTDFPSKVSQDKSKGVASAASSNHTYPPSTSNAFMNSDYTFSSRETSSWVSTVPSWIKGTKNLISTSLGYNTFSATPTGIREVYSSIGTSNSATSGRSHTSGLGDLAFSILETPNIPLGVEMTEKFKKAFAYDDREILLGYFPGYIYRFLPVFGRFYISMNFCCFKASGPLTVRTNMTLPIKDILATEKSKAWHFGRYGLIIIVRGHEELFLEFNDEEKREAFIALLNKQMEDVRRRLLHGATDIASPGKRDALILEELGPEASTSSLDPVAQLSESMSDSVPAIMFTSRSSSFLTFKPSKPMHFTFLTIGSRGDVQPYIALAKGLLADGHRCRIATHGEFKEWIESYGIEFGYVGGDPAELMRICVENGTFTVSFLKEGLTKFRGWVDDLLRTSWEACQGTDVLIESPSAMGGYHIAEALGIPYYRAFTMTWTRTRAYPHAFAVPEHKMGGSYNYMTYVMFDQVFWRATSGQINRWRRTVLHLGGTSLDRMEPHKIPFLYNFSPHVVPPPLDWPEWIQVTGYWFLDDADVSAKKWTPPQDLVEFLDNARNLNKKVVYIGFGSIVVSDPKSMTRCVIDAVLESGVHCVLSKGWSDRLHVKSTDAAEPEEPLPPQIYTISSIPHDWLFRRIDAACHHGGAGTTGASLRAGIPTIIRPFFGDQFFWADRVEALGVGTGVRKLTVSALAEALRSATTDIKQIDRAKLIGEQIGQENGVKKAIESIYRDLEYARSLVKRRGVDDEIDDLDDLDADESAILALRGAQDYSGYDSSGSGRGASEDWSLVGDTEDRRSSFGSRISEGRPSKDSPNKRSSIAAAVRSVLPEALTSTSPKSLRRRSLSLSRS